jgi:leader peptidase (prepilin peptidase)/N-methyltransferase
MGLGDVHLLAAVGAVTGWITPSLAFFIAPFFGLLWALKAVLTRRQREIPYGPWLAAASLVVMLIGDGLLDFIRGL